MTILAHLIPTGYGYRCDRCGVVRVAQTDWAWDTRYRGDPGLTEWKQFKREHRECVAGNLRRVA